MGVRMIILEARVGSFPFIRSKHRAVSSLSYNSSHTHSPGIDQPYGGLFREEAIMLLRRFYIQENDKGW